MAQQGINPDRLFDKRVVQRNIDAGRVTKADYAKFVATLPDRAEAIKPKDEGGDDDGFEPTEAEPAAAPAAAPAAEPQMATATAEPSIAPPYAQAPPTAAPAPAAPAPAPSDEPDETPPSSGSGPMG
jgi:hypothetical protein